MPRIHSWREVIAPRDCRCIVHRATLHPAAGSSTGTAGTSSSLEPPLSPTRFPPPLTPPSRNEQRAISLLLNACHKSPRAPSRSSLSLPIRPPSLPPATLSRLSPLFHLFSPQRLHPHLYDSASSLSLSQFLFTMFHRFYPPYLLRTFFLLLRVLFYRVGTDTFTDGREKTKNAQNAHSVLFTSLFREK